MTVSPKPTSPRRSSLISPGTALHEATAMLGTSPPVSIPMPHAANAPGRPVPIPSPSTVNGPVSIEKDLRDGGPARLPTPMTVCDIHQIMEQEQEQLVNRALRSHVTSPTSSTCSSFNDLSDSSALHHHRPPHPHPATSRDRSHSNISTISLTGGTAPGVSGIAPSRERENGNPVVFVAHSPGSTPLQEHHPHLSHHHPHHRHHPSTGSIASYHGGQLGVGVGADLKLNTTNLRNPSGGSGGCEGVTSSPSSARPRRPSMNAGSLPPTGSMLSAGIYKSELETAKKENEMLKRRIRELEGLVKQLRVAEKEKDGKDGKDEQQGRPSSSGSGSSSVRQQVGNGDGGEN